MLKRTLAAVLAVLALTAGVAASADARPLHGDPFSHSN